MIRNRFVEPFCREKYIMDKKNLKPKIKIVQLEAGISEPVCLYHQFWKDIRTTSDTNELYEIARKSRDKGG